MASPTSSLATLRPDLATFSEFDLAMDRQGFIAQRVAPVINVASQAGSFGKIPVEQLLQTRTTNRAPGSGYARGNWQFGTATYACEEHGAEEPIDDREAKMYANYFDAEQISAARAYDAVLRNAEIRMAALIFSATWSGGGATLTTGIADEWDDYSNAIPITDVEAAVRKVWSNSGMWPNALIINRHVFRNLRQCEQVIERINSEGAGFATRAADVTPAQLAAVFDLDYIIVNGGAKNTAKEGQNVVFDKLWSDEYAMVCRVATTSDPREPCIARTFHWAEDGSSIGGTVESYREESKRSDIIRVRHDVDEIVMYTEMGHLLSNVTT
jgi:hypothetical protein